MSCCILPIYSVFTCLQCISSYCCICCYSHISICPSSWIIWKCYIYIFYQICYIFCFYCFNLIYISSLIFYPRIICCSLNLIIYCCTKFFCIIYWCKFLISWLRWSCCYWISNNSASFFFICCFYTYTVCSRCCFCNNWFCFVYICYCSYCKTSVISSIC